MPQLIGCGSGMEWRGWRVFVAFIVLVAASSTGANGGQIGKIEARGKTENAAMEKAIRDAAVKVLEDRYGFGPAHPVSERISKLPIDVLKSQIIEFPPQGRIRKWPTGYSGTLRFYSNDNGLEAFVTKTVSRMLEDAFVKNVGVVLSVSVAANSGRSLSSSARKKFVFDINESIRTELGRYGVKLQALPPNLIKQLKSFSRPTDRMDNITAAMKALETSEKGLVDVLIVGNITINRVEATPEGGVLSYWLLNGRLIENVANRSAARERQINFAVDGGASYGKDFADSLSVISLKAAYDATTEGILANITVPESLTKRLVIRLCGQVAESKKEIYKISMALKEARGAGELENSNSYTKFTLSNSKYDNAMELWGRMESVFKALGADSKINGNSIEVGGCLEAVASAQTPDADDVHIVLAEATRETLAGVASQIGMDTKLMLIRMTSRQGKTQCEPLSQFLINGFRSGADKFIKRKNLGFKFITGREWTPEQTVATIYGEWDYQGRGKVGLNITANAKAGQVNITKVFKAQTLPETAQRCLLSISKIMKPYVMKRDKVVFSAPDDTAKMIGELKKGNTILIDARIQGNPWKIVRLPDDDTYFLGYRDRRGFIYAKTGEDLEEAP